MSDNNTMSLDDEFKKQAIEAEQAERDKLANKGKGYSKDYEKLNWSGLQKGIPLIIRALGEKPDFHVLDGTKPGSKFDARVVNIAKIINDKGKKMRVILPLKDMDENHIMWRIIDKVNAFDWVDRKRVFNHEGKPIFNIVNKNNIMEKAYGLEAKGWKGGQFFIMNMIDRTMMDWHRENKHTRLLSKDINVTKSKKDGSEMVFITEGVPAFGFTNIINTSILKFYGFWENYDIGVERTGLTQPSFKLFNAGKNPEMAGINEKYVVQGPLTAEEKAWERYDLDKLFQVTSYTKLYNGLQKTIVMIDYELGTNFLAELKKLSDEEKAKWEAEKKANGGEAHPEDDTHEHDHEEASEDDVSAYVDDSEDVRTPTPKAEEGVRDISSSKAMVLPPGWDKLTETEREQVIGSQAPEEGSKAWVLTYKDGVGKTPKCPECATKAPLTFKHCPGCGMSF